MSLSSILNRTHLYLILGLNQWPINMSGSIFITISGLILYIYNYDSYLMLVGIIWLMINLFPWFQNIIWESDYYHTLIIRKCLINGFALFIVSEIMLFLGFFWAFFHSSLCPSIVLGMHWLSIGISKAQPTGIPVFNTLLLIISGLTITWTHKAIIIGSFRNCVRAFVATILLAISFLYSQAFEYFELPFNISDGVYPSCFYMLTGLHGLHVLFGTIFILTCFARLLKFKLLKNHHLSLVLAIYYWHFVDIIWIFLFLSIYCWGSA